MNLQESIRRILRESTFFLRRIDMRLMEKEFFETLNYATDIFLRRYDNNQPFDFKTFKNRVIDYLMDDYHDELSNGGSKDFPYDEVYEYLSNHFHDKIKERFDLIFYRELNESENKEGKYTKAVKVIVNDFKNEEFVCDIDVSYYADKYEVEVKIDRKEFEKKYENRDISYANILMTGYLDKLKRTIRQEIKNFLPVDVLVWFKQINCDKGLNESEDNEEKKIQKNLKAIRTLLDIINFDGLCEMWVEYNPEDGDYEIRSKTTKKNLDTAYMVRELKYIEDTIRSWGMKTYVFTPWYVENCEDEVEFLNESETKTNSSLHKLLNVLFDGFDNADYDWANYMCGMGECCDPYAIGFTLPESDYDDYIFKLVDGEMYDDDGDYPKEFRDELPEVCYEQPNLKNPDFNTIVFYGAFAEEIEDYMGHAHNWNLDLLKIINNQFGCDAKRIVVI